MVINFYAEDHSMRYLKDKDPIVKSTAVALSNNGYTANSYLSI